MAMSSDVKAGFIFAMWVWGIAAVITIIAGGFLGHALYLLVIA